MMLHEFIRVHREQILERARSRVAARAAPRPSSTDLDAGMPRFVDDLIEMLRGQVRSNAAQDGHSARHGSARFATGCTVAQVVHDYGDVCQVVTELAIEKAAAISTEEFRALNSCLDDAIAGAVTAHASASQKAYSSESVERLGQFAHELRNHLSSAVLAFKLLQSGTVAVRGSTGSLLGRSLGAIRDLVDRGLTEVRLDAGVHDSQVINVAALLEELEIAASVAASDAGVTLSFDCGAADVEVTGDRQLLVSAVSNVLQNAIKFTAAGGHVALRARATPQRVLVEVEDECGGMTDEMMQKLFTAFQQGGHNKSGVGLGLTIVKRAIASMGGEVRVHNTPGKCCGFTLDLARAGPRVGESP